MSSELERQRREIATKYGFDPNDYPTWDEATVISQFEQAMAEYDPLVREDERRKTVEACQGQLRVMAELAPTEHKSIYQLAIKQLRSLLAQPAQPAQEDKNG